MFRDINLLLKRPSPFPVNENEHLTDMSIIKQSLLFTDTQASIGIFKIAQICNLNLHDYISSLQDLQLIIDALPAQQYYMVLNNFATNVTTIRQNQAILKKRGTQSKMITFIQKSAIINAYTPDLGLQRYQDDDEIKRSVEIKVLPLNWLIGTDESKIFEFLRENLEKMEGSLLIDAVFDAYWNR